MRIALVHDWLTGMRGGEKVFEFLCRLYPEADRFTLVHEPGSVSAEIEGRGVTTSWLQGLPGAKRWYRYYLPILPLAAESLDLLDYDLVISNSTCVVKGVLTRPEALHISYVHSPMRYIWDLHQDYFPRSNWLNRLLAPPLLACLRAWDVTSAQRVDHFIANSSFIEQRIAKYYRRSSTVIHPPVETSRFEGVSKPGEAFLVVSALVVSKGVDYIVEAFNQNGRPLRIVGTGPLEQELRRRARPNIEFLGWVSDEELVAEYLGCRALIHGAIEDFGIAPLEAAAAGKPTIALGRGGVLDTIIPSGTDRTPTGVFFAERNAASLALGLLEFELIEQQFEPEALRAHARCFGEDVAREQLLSFIERVVREHFGTGASSRGPRPVVAQAERRTPEVAHAQ